MPPAVDYAQFIHELVENLALLMGMVVVYGAVRDRFSKRQMATPPWAVGLVGGVAAIGAMVSGAELAPGVVMDGRIAPLAYSGLLGGPVGALVASVPPLAMRAWMGGTGMLPGFGEILGAAISGVIFQRFLASKNREFDRAQVPRFAAVAVFMTVLSAALVGGFDLPGKTGASGADTAVVFVILVPFMFFCTWTVGRLLIWDQERTGMATRLNETERRYQIFLEQSREAIFIWEVQPPLSLDENLDSLKSTLPRRMILLETNLRGVDLLGHDTVPEVIGKSLATLWPQPPIALLTWIEGFYESRAHFYESRFSFPSRQGGLDHFLIQTQGVVDQGRVTTIWITMRNINDIVRTEEEAQRTQRRLEEAQRMETLGTLAGGVAHDFKNILTPIQGQSELLLQNKSLNEKERQSLETIQRASQRGGDIVRQMLTYARRDPGKPEAVRLSDVINDCLIMAGASIPEKVTVIRQFDGGSAVVMADRARLEQVALNLIQNALDAIEGKKGLLRLALEKESAGKARMVIEDNGTGMDEQTAARVFEPFFTTKEKTKGTGLGMYVAHGIVNDLGGSIRVSSEPGKGTTFIVTLPLVDQQPDAVPADHRVLHGQGERLLFVDDDTDVRETLGAMLTKTGYEVTLRESGESALEFLETKEGRVDLIITDLGMPGLNGAELAGKVRAQWPDLPVMILTGDGASASQHPDLAASLTLEKPVTLIELSEAVAGLLEKG